MKSFFKYILGKINKQNTKRESVKKIFASSGYERNPEGNEGVLLDTAAIFLDKEGNVDSRKNVLFNENNKSVDSNSDSLIIDLENIPDHIEKIMLISSISSKNSTSINFGMINKPFIKLTDQDGTIMMTMDFSVSNKDDNAIIISTLRRNKEKWKMDIVSVGFKSGIREVLKKYKFYIK